MKNNQLRQVVFPILAAFIWGTAFVAQDVCADAMGAFTFNGTRYYIAVLSLLMLIPPALRYNDKILPWALILLVIASWIDKSLGLLIGGFVPNMFETVTEYTPTIPEILVALGVYGLGGIIISVLWKIAMDVKKENGTFALKDN